MRRQHFPSNSHAPSAGNTNKNSSTNIIGEKTLNFATAGSRSPVSIDKSSIVKNYLRKFSTQESQENLKEQRQTLTNV